MAKPVKAVLLTAVVALAGFLLSRIARRYSLDDIVDSLAAIPVDRLLLAGAFAALSYLCLTGFDWLAVRYAGHPLAYRKTALASFVSLSIGHNIGIAALSSGAVRYRFYSGWGLSTGQIVKVIAFCGVTVGLGLAVLGGMALLVIPGVAAQYSRLPRLVIAAAGWTCLGLAAVYLGLAVARQRPLVIARLVIPIPHWRLALGQLIIAPANFACVAACLYQAMAALADVTYAQVAAIYVLANVTAIVSHVPGGLGVLESVVLYLAGGGKVIGALLVFRAVYYLVPLALGGSLLAIIELRRFLADRRRRNET